MARKKSAWPWVFGLVAIAWLSQDNSPDSTSPSRSADKPLPSPVEIGLSSPNSPQQPTSNTRQTVSPAPPRFDVVRSAPPLSRSSPAIDGRTMYVDASRLNVRDGPSKQTRSFGQSNEMKLSRLQRRQVIGRLSGARDMKAGSTVDI